MELERGSFFGGHCFFDDSDGNRVRSFGSSAQMILRLACCYPSISVQWTEGYSRRGFFVCQK